MKTIKLKEGESIKIIGDKLIGERGSFVVITNLNGDIVNRTDSRREELG